MSTLERQCLLDLPFGSSQIIWYNPTSWASAGSLPGSIAVDKSACLHHTVLDRAALESLIGKFHDALPRASQWLEQGSVPTMKLVWEDSPLFERAFGFSLVCSFLIDSTSSLVLWYMPQSPLASFLSNLLTTYGLFWTVGSIGIARAVLAVGEEGGSDEIALSPSYFAGLSKYFSDVLF